MAVVPHGPAADASAVLLKKAELDRLLLRLRAHLWKEKEVCKHSDLSFVSV